MIVVDTSVLIDFLNGYITTPVSRLRTLIREEPYSWVISSCAKY